MIQSQNPNILIATMIITTAIVIILFFLPALIELKKPKDAGPRLIDNNTPKVRIGALKVPITDIEEEQKFNSQSAIKIEDSLYPLPNLEGQFSIFLNTNPAFFHCSMATDIWPAGLP